MPNLGSINSYAIGASAGGYFEEVGSGILVELHQSVFTVASGILINIQPSVGLAAKDIFISIQQEVNLSQSGGGLENPIIKIEQQILNLASGPIIEFEQFVTSDAVFSRLHSTGWDLDIVLGGHEVRKSDLIGEVSVSFAENSNALAEFTLKIPKGPIDIYQNLGKDVIIVNYVRLDTGPYQGIIPDAKRVFTGKVDAVDVDIVKRTITIKCMASLDELIEEYYSYIGSQYNIGHPSREFINHYVGDYSQASTADRVKALCEIYGHVLDIEPSGRVTNTMVDSTISEWNAPIFNHSTIYHDQIFRNSLRIETQQKVKSINKIVIDVNFAGLVMHWVNRKFVWTHPALFEPCLIAWNGYTETTKDMILDAVKSSSWNNYQGVAFGPGLKGGRFYSCRTGWGPPTSTWYQTRTVTITNSYARDSAGNPIKDSSGNPIIESYTALIEDWTDTLTLSAQWFMSKGFTQNVDFSVRINVLCTDSISKFGEVVLHESYSYDFNDTTQSADWEQIELNLDHEVERDISYIQFQVNIQNEINSIVQAAQNKIRMAHRETKVSVRTHISPSFNTRNSCGISFGGWQNQAHEKIKGGAIGKFESITHVYNISTGEAYTDAIIACSPVIGPTAFNTIPTVYPPSIRTTQQYMPSEGETTMGNHFGKDPSKNPNSVYWSGMVGNAYPNGITQDHSDWHAGMTYTRFSPRFIVKTPEIPPELTDSYKITAEYTANTRLIKNAFEVEIDE